MLRTAIEAEADGFLAERADKRDRPVGSSGFNEPDLAVVLVERDALI